MNSKFKYMKYQILFLLCGLATSAHSQSLQLHYDFRHSMDPARNSKDFSSLVFEEWESQDYGSFDFKGQVDFTGDEGNVGQIYMQAQQSLKFWEPTIFIFLEYSGGVGVTDPGLFGYHINNAFSAGGSYLFSWEGTWFSPSVVYKYTVFIKPSHDVMLSLYWGRNFFDDKISFAGDFEVWGENRNHGDAATIYETGKRTIFYAEPQIWYNLNESFSVGTKVNLYYHVLAYENSFQIYPTAAVSYRF